MVVVVFRNLLRFLQRRHGERIYPPAGADGTRTNYGSPLTTTAAYRCPDKQNDINSRALYDSRHHHGDAMDWSSGSSDTIWTSIKNAAKYNYACVEPLAQSTND